LTFYQFSFNGFAFGSGTPYSVLSVDGLESLPEMRVQDSDRGFNDGMFTGQDFYSGRHLTFDLLITSGNGNSAFQNFNLLQAALIPQTSGTSTLNFQLSVDDAPQTMQVRVRNRRAKVDPEYTFGYIQVQIQAFAPDPRYYNQATNTIVLSPTVASGRTYNRTYNLTYGGGSQTQTQTVLNSGSVATGPVVTITGPGSNLTIGNLTTNQYLTLNYTASASDVFVLDLQNKTVTLNGTPARNFLSGLSQWFMANPGVNQFYFNGTGTTPSVTTATVVWQNAFV
jgi:phage-related protein